MGALFKEMWEIYVMKFPDIISKKEVIILKKIVLLVLMRIRLFYQMNIWLHAFLTTLNMYIVYKILLVIRIVLITIVMLVSLETLVIDMI